MKVLEKFTDWVNAAAEYFSAVALGLMTVIVFIQVLSRLFAGSIRWSEELARYLMIYMVYVGTSVGVKNGSHIAVDFAASLLPPSARRALDIIGDLLMILCFAVMCFFGQKLVSVTMMQRSPAMQIRMGYVYFAMVAGGALMLLHCVSHLIRTLLGSAEEDDA